MSNARDYIAAALCWIADSTNVDIGGSSSVEKLRAIIKSHFEVELPNEVVESALDMMVDRGLARRFDDPYATSRFLLDEADWLSFYNSVDDSSSPFSKARFLGKDWLAEALTGIAQAQEGRSPPIDTKIPASDRVVSLSDNQRASIEIPLLALTKEIKESNSAQETMGDVAEQIVAEVEAGNRLLMADRVRLSALLKLLLKPLKYLADTFSEAAIGALAAELITELLKLL